MIVGIDPGMSGGLTALTDQGGWLGGIRMPLIQIGKRKMVDGHKFAQFVAQHWDETDHDDSSERITCVIEAPNSMPGQGLQSTFNFGRMCGAVEALGSIYSLQLVTPATWKKAFALTKDKRASLDRAALEFGRHKTWDVLANDGIAEAGLIALWYLRTMRKL
jgi:hypothetical protein